MWPRYGSFPGFNPIVELSLTFHNLVVGANGQRQAMFLENVSGLAERILRNFDLSPVDCALVISSSGGNVVSVEMAEGFRRRGIKVVALVSRAHAEATPYATTRAGCKLIDCADLVLDTGAPVGDALVSIPGLETPVAPGSTVGGALLVNAIKAEVAARLTAAGQPPPVLDGCRGGGARALDRPVRGRLRRARPPARAALRQPRPRGERMKERPLRTTVIGSYPLPAWLELASRHLDEFGESDRAELVDDAVAGRGQRPGRRRAST